MGKINFFFFIIMLCTLCTLVSAQPPFDEQTGGTLTVEFSKIDILEQNTDHHFHFHLFNATNFIDNATGQCGLTIVQPNGSLLYKNGNIPYHAGSENEWGVTINGGNFTELGQHSYVVECNTSQEVGLSSLGFSVTTDGTDPSTAKALVYGIIMIITLLLFIGAFAWFIYIPFDRYGTTEDNIVQVTYNRTKKTVMFFASYVLLFFLFFVGKLMTESMMFNNNVSALINAFYWIFLVGFMPVTMLVVGLAILYTLGDSKLAEAITRGFNA